MSKEWKWWYFIFVPSTKIRNYFGSKIAMYFSFLEHLSLWLILPALAGIPVFILQFFYDDGLGWKIYQIIFAVIMILWSMALFETWKRKELKLAVKWGQTDFYE